MFNLYLWGNIANTSILSILYWFLFINGAKRSQIKDGGNEKCQSEGHANFDDDKGKGSDFIPVNGESSQTFLNIKKVGVLTGC